MFNIPPIAKVIWRRGHGLKSHLTDWWRHGQQKEKITDNVFISLSSTYLTGVGSTGFFQSKLSFTKVPGMFNICIPGVGQTFFQGGGVNLLIDIICDFYWTPVPIQIRVIITNFIQLRWFFYGCYFHLSSCTFYKCMFCSNLKCAWIKKHCRFPACNLGWFSVCFQKCVLCIYHTPNCSLRHSQKVPIWYRKSGPLREKTCPLGLWTIKLQNCLPIRPACTSAQSDQRICFSLIGI